MADVQLVARARKGWGLVLKQDETQAVRALLALLSGAAAAIHFSVAGEHLTVWWLHGAFFVAVAWAQALFAVLIVVRPAPIVLQAGILGNGLVIATWAASRTVGIPIGPTAGLPELARLEDVTATVFEVLLVLGCLALLSGRVPARRLSAPVVAGGLLLTGAAVVLTSAALVSAASGGHHRMPGGGQMTGLAHVGGSGQGGGHGGHSGSPIPSNDPLLLELRGAVRQGGAVAAMDLLEQRAAGNPTVQGLSHQYVHSLSRFAYTVAPDPATAFTSCDERFEGGCYHGVLQGYFEDHPNFTGQDVATLCSTLGAEGVLDLRWQCLHGLGHGLTLFFDHNLLRPLRYCDFLTQAWDRGSCYGGVFMENVIWAQNSDGAVTGESVIAEDPQYPCNAVADKYKWDCWQMQTSTILDLVAWDFQAAFAECNRVRGPYDEVCYESMGRDIAGYTLHDPVETLSMCLDGQPKLLGNCLAGATKQIADWNNGDLGPSIELCKRAPKEGKLLCYEAVGQTVVFFNSDNSRAGVRECAAAERKWEDVCRRAAYV